MRRLTSAAMIIIGAGAFAACLRSAVAGMRDVMIRDGGSCGNGGPYVIDRPCSIGDIRLLLVGIVGGLIAVAVYAGGTSRVGRSASSAGLVALVAAFGSLGWSWIGLIIHPPAGQVRSVGWLVGGIVLAGMAISGLAPLVLAPLVMGSIGDLPKAVKPVAIGGRVEQPIVLAVIPPGLRTVPPTTFGGWSADGTTALGVTGSPVDAIPQPARPPAWL